MGLKKYHGFGESITCLEVTRNVRRQHNDFRVRGLLKMFGMFLLDGIRSNLNSGNIIKFFTTIAQDICHISVSFRSPLNSIGNRNWSRILNLLLQNSLCNKSLFFPKKNSYANIQQRNWLLIHGSLFIRLHLIVSNSPLNFIMN